MNFITHNEAGEDGINTQFTSLRGHIKTTRANLTDVFGKPIFYGEGDKVTVEWMIEFDNGVVATVYDWKRYDLGIPGLHEVEEYNIGGHEYDAASLVQEALNKRVSLV